MGRSTFAKTSAKASVFEESYGGRGREMGRIYQFNYATMFL